MSASLTQNMAITIRAVPGLHNVATRATTVGALRVGHRTATGPSSTRLYHYLSGRDTPASTSPSSHEHVRSFYTTHIYHGQPSPSSTTSTSKISDHVGLGSGPGPITGAGTGVFISAQMFGEEVKGNPTESEADVAADRTDADPLAPELHHTIRLGAGEAAPRPTESEEDVAADRGDPFFDPLRAMKKAVR